MPPIPYIFNIPNQHKEHTAIRNNIGPARAWRAPSHPQAAVITMGALDDLAAKLNMDPLDLWLKNLEISGPRRDVYFEELAVAADLMGWKEKWRPRGQNVSGSIGDPEEHQIVEGQARVLAGDVEPEAQRRRARRGRNGDRLADLADQEVARRLAEWLRTRPGATHGDAEGPGKPAADRP